LFTPHWFVRRHQTSLWLIESNTGDRSRSRNLISIVLWRGQASSENDWNLTLGCLRFLDLLRHPRVNFKPRQRTIEILPLGVWYFSILTCHRCLIIFLTQTSPQICFFFLVYIFEDDRITNINEIIRNVKETPNHERFKL